VNKILVVEDEKSMRDLLAMMLRKEGYEVDTAESAVLARSRISGANRYDILISDISMPEMTGLELLEYARKASPETDVLIMTAYGTKETAIEALNNGAAWYVEKPFDLDEMKMVVRKTLAAKALVHENEDLKEQNQDLRKELRGQFTFGDLVGRSVKMRDIFDLIKRVAGTNSTIMISGESGTGKELIARAIHHNSSRASSPFVSINCGALPDELLESELFGHMKGSFTGAGSTKMGLFEAAGGGSIFLDEIGETSPAMQIKLLRVLQERTIRKVGGTEEIPVDVRVITATNQHLEEMVQEKTFREDLFYRINVIPINMPALREKPEDIPALAEQFLEKYKALIGKPMEGISREAMDLLEAYRWPGNVRQLENVIERAVALETEVVIQADSLSPEIRKETARDGDLSVRLPDGGVDLDRHLEELRRKYMMEAMERVGGVQTKAAEMLGMTFRSFRYFAKKYNTTGKESAGPHAPAATGEQGM